MNYKEDYSKKMGSTEIDLNLLADNTFYLEGTDEKGRKIYRYKGLQGEALTKNCISNLNKISNIDKRIPIPIS